jgi:hypothetical protein
MNCYSFEHSGAKLAAACWLLFSAMSATAPMVQAGTIVDDSWADGGRTNGADALDTNWWSSTSNTGNSIEVSVGALGMITGTSGRGIHGTFTPQSLNTGDTIKATFTFTTPATIGTNATGAFRIGLFNSNGQALAADIQASTSSPNTIYDPVAGYMMDFDMRTGAENIQFREKDPVPGTNGVLLATTTGFASLASGGSAYTFAANTTYTGVYSIKKTAGGLELSGSLSQGNTLLSTFTTTDASASTSAFDVLGFHANSNIFGSTTTAGNPDNGIDFSNIKIEYIIPEPAGLTMFGLTALLLVARRRRRKEC